MANKFELKKWKLEEFGEIYNWLEERIKDHSFTYGQTDELEQDRQWNSETKEMELAWEDEEKTVPKMVKKWGRIEIPDDELTEEIITKKETCEAIKAFIEKQI